FAWGPQLLLEVVAYNVALLLLCLWALAVDRESIALALLVPVQNLFYRQFMYVVALKAVLRALKGIRVGWTRVTRLGSSRLHGSGAPWAVAMAGPARRCCACCASTAERSHSRAARRLLLRRLRRRRRARPPVAGI